MAEVDGRRRRWGECRWREPTADVGDSAAELERRVQGRFRKAHPCRAVGETGPLSWGLCGDRRGAPFICPNEVSCFESFPDYDQVPECVI